MDIAFCYENVLPARGGCVTYMLDLARRLVADGHRVHLYACRWDESALPKGIHYHALTVKRGPRFLRPWRFSEACQQALRHSKHDVTVGFDKTYGQDVLYPQGGLHAASAEHNLRKHSNIFIRGVARMLKAFDLAHWSFSALERRQYKGERRPLIIVNSEMVQHHFAHYYGISPSEVRVVRSAIDVNRFREQDRPRRRIEWREHWGIHPEETVGLIAAMNYRLKGLRPLLHAIKLMPADVPFRLLVAGDSRTHGYERMARRLGIHRRVRFIGYCGNMGNAYFASDFLVHPTFYDPCSLVVLEALACGLPVITTRWNGAKELLTPLVEPVPATAAGKVLAVKEGFVIDDPHQVQQVADCMTQLTDPARRLACTQAARQTASRWTFDLHYQNILQVFTEAAARKQAA